MARTNTAIRRLARHAFALILAVGLFTAASCSDSDSPTPEPDPTSSPSATPSTSTKDQTDAAAAVLRLADLGKTYTPHVYQPNQYAEADDLVLSRCLGRPPTVQHQTAQAGSPLFTAGDARQIQAEVTFVVSEQVAGDDLTAMSDDRAPGCLKALFLHQLTRSGAAQPRLVVERVAPSPAGGDTMTHRLTTTTTAPNGQDIPTLTDLVVVTKGRAEITAFFQDVNQPVDAPTQRRTIDAMLARL